ncbi:hypothetical protein N0V90_004691 [Kalmusia sp. IMI 367209]|nr:hypothetical protein N0V90_004691 [Kalmusia sp. IMI 367209]
MPVIVRAYDRDWPFQFLKIKERLETLLSDVAYKSIEHVGSTSVPDLAAKPIIDVDIIVTRENVRPAIDALVSKAGFINSGDLGIVDRWCLKDPEQQPRRNIYVCVDGAFQTRNHLGLRDTLRRNAALREEYAAVKLDLAARMTLVEYIEAKSGVVQKILAASGVLNEEELAAIREANVNDGRFHAVVTERLVLREFVMTDDESFFELESKEEVARYQTWPPRTRDQAHKEVLEIINNSATVPRTHVELAVEYEGKFIGRVGANVKLENNPPHADLWFSFMPKSQGKGFATEAMKAFVPLLGSPLELEIECDPRNTGSSKMAERMGFEKIGLTEKAFECKGEWVGSLVYQKRV